MNTKKLALYFPLTTFSTASNTRYLSNRVFTNSPAILFGNPSVVLDKKFGNAIVLDGSSTYSRVDTTGTETIADGNTITVQMWVKMSENSAKERYLFASKLSRAKNNGFEIFVKNGIIHVKTPSQTAVAFSGTVLPLDQWAHLSLIVNATANNVQLVLNGELKDTKTLSLQADDLKIGQFTHIGVATDVTKHFKGAISHLRFYKEALDIASIRQVLESDLVTHEAVKRFNPLKFKWLDNRGNEAIFFGTTDSNNVTKLEIANQSEVDVQWNASSASAASKDNYHLKIVFKPGELTNPNSIDKLGDAQDKLFKEVHANGTVDVYILFTAGRVIKSNQIYEIPFTNLKASGNGGGRSTVVRYEYQSLIVENNPVPVAQNAEAQLTIANHLGSRTSPFNMNWIGNDFIQYQTESKLTLEILNSLSTPLAVNAQTRFVIKLDQGDDALDVTTNDKAETIVVTQVLDKAKEKKNVWNIAQSKQGSLVTWIITPDSKTVDIPANGKLVFTIDKIKSEKAVNNSSNFYVEYKNVLGYWDNKITLPIRKISAPQAFKVKGDADKYYPIYFFDTQWEMGQRYQLSISRSNVHIDTNNGWKGSLSLEITGHSRNYGHRSNSLEYSLNQYNQNINGPRFFMGAENVDRTAGVIVWLRGDATYHWYSPTHMQLSDFSIATKQFHDGKEYKVKTFASESKFDAFHISQSALLPTGSIIMWNGAHNAVPAGWKLCDGNFGTPNLSGKFIVGYKAGNAEYSVGATGGEEKHVLTTQELPAHSHGVTDPGHRHSTQKTLDPSATDGDDNSFNVYARRGSTSFTDSVKTGISIQNTGGGAAHENRPPYYALCYIMKM